MPNHCPSCQRLIYSENLTHCGYCGVLLPNRSAEPPTFGPEDIEEACRAMEGMIGLLSAYGSGYPSLVAELVQHISDLKTGGRNIQRQALTTIRGRCNHCSYGDAMTADGDKYLSCMKRLHDLCAKGLKYLDADSSALTIRRRIKLMWDYHCWPLWECGGSQYALEPDSLPLSQSTKDRLKKWADVPDAKLAEYTDSPSDITWTAEETRAFETEGRELWKILQRELGEEFCVVYHSTTERRDLSPEEHRP